MPKLQAESIEPYAVGLRKLPFVNAVRVSETVPHGDTGDVILELSLADGSQKTLHVEVKASHLSGDAARYQLARYSASPADWLLAAPYVGAPLGESLEEQGINFIDRHGNCYLRIGDHFVARIQGKTPPKPPARSKAMRAAGYQVMFAILAEPELVGAPQRDIAAAAGTSRQPVGDLLERWREERLLVKRRRRYAWVDGPDAGLLERWVAGYRSMLRPKLVVGRFRLPVREPQQVEHWLEEHLELVRYGGTAGAYRLEPHYRGALTVAHLGPASEEMRRRLKAVPAAEGELVWMRHIGQASQKGETPDTVHPLLVYSELVSDPDPRAGEAAHLIRERRLSWSL